MRGYEIQYALIYPDELIRRGLFHNFSWCGKVDLIDKIFDIIRKLDNDYHHKFNIKVNVKLLEDLCVYFTNQLKNMVLHSLREEKKLSRNLFFKEQQNSHPAAGDAKEYERQARRDVLALIA